MLWVLEAGKRASKNDYPFYIRKVRRSGATTTTLKSTFSDFKSIPYSNHWRQLAVLLEDDFKIGEYA